MYVLVVQLYTYIYNIQLYINYIYYVLQAVAHRQRVVRRQTGYKRMPAWKEAADTIAHYESENSSSACVLL